MATLETSVHHNWPALNIELVPVTTLIPYIRNPRQHSEQQVAQLAASMKEFGWVNPVLRDEDQTILAGHGRIMAAQKLGWPDAPVMTAVGWSEAKKRAYVIADNKLALNATWDVGLLNAEIEALSDDDFDLNLIGFSDQDLERLADDLMSERFNEAQNQSGDDEHKEDPVPRSTSNPDQVALTIPMTVDQRQLIFDAIQHAKRELGLDQSAEALWAICRLYLEQRQ